MTIGNLITIILFFAGYIIWVLRRVFTGTWDVGKYSGVEILFIMVSLFSSAILILAALVSLREQYWDLPL